MAQDFNVDDASFWDSVTLKLDMAKGTFSIIDAKPKAAVIAPGQSQQQIDSEGYTVGFLGCARTGEIAKGAHGEYERVVICNILVTNNQADRLLLAEGYSNINTPGISSNQISTIPNVFGNSVSSLLDNFGQDYFGDVYDSAGTHNPPSIFQSQSVPVKISFVYKINMNSSSISIFMPFLTDIKTKNVLQLIFKDIKF